MNGQSQDVARSGAREWPRQSGSPHIAGTNAPPAEPHLTEEQIDSQLIGDLGPPWSDHLAACSVCESRVAEAAAPLADFKAVTLAWGERRSSTLPLHLDLARSAQSPFRLAGATAAAAVLALLFALPALRMHQHPQAADFANVPTRTEASASNTEQIVQDNQMLKAIDRELDASVGTAATLGLEPVRETAPAENGGQDSTPGSAFVQD